MEVAKYSNNFRGAVDDFRRHLGHLAFPSPKCLDLNED